MTQRPFDAVLPRQPANRHAGRKQGWPVALHKWAGFGAAMRCIPVRGHPVCGVANSSPAKIKE
jgi:hypothetical protein